MVAIKICGMKDPENICAVAALGPDYLGFICWNGSPRFVGDTFTVPEEAAANSKVCKVGVFVDQTLEEIMNWQGQLGLSAIQLHGEESPEFCSAVRAALKTCEIWKAIPVTDSLPNAQLNEYFFSVDRFLFENKSAQRGGSGQSFHWEVLSDYHLKKPYILSGGVGMDNIKRALHLAVDSENLSILDLNSKLESEVGIKDIALVRQVLTKKF